MVKEPQTSLENTHGIRKAEWYSTQFQLSIILRAVELLK